MRQTCAFVSWHAMIGWDEQDWRDFFEERAAILEYDGGYSRQAAENVAALETQILRESLEAAK
jgi:hypothetical protein